MQKYELMIVVQGQIPEDLAEEVNLKVKKNLEEIGAKDIKEDFWGRRKLAYKIDQQDHGYYDIFEFSIIGEKVNKIEPELKLIGEVIRHLLTKKEEPTKELKDKKIKKISAIDDKKALLEKKEEVEVSKKEITKKPESDKEEITTLKKQDDNKKETSSRDRLKELDQKIDEILKD